MRKMFFGKKIIIISAIFLALSALMIFFVMTKQARSKKQVEASSATSSITTQANWEVGSLVNADSTSSPGSIEISNKSLGGAYVFSGAGDVSYNGSFSQNGTHNGGDAYENSNGRWLYWDGAGFWLLGPDFASSVYTIDVPLLDPSQSICAIHWIASSPPTGEPAPSITCSASATHTTGATQIDGGENFWEWEGFTPTQTVPANTSVTYRYRTSTNGAAWTAWVGDIGSVTSRSGDNRYRYLQVEATLSNTDGVSTPTIDSYSVDYHTEVKPTQPSAETATTE